MLLNIKKLSKLVIQKKWEIASGVVSQYMGSLKVRFLEEDLVASAHGVDWRMVEQDLCEFVFDKRIAPSEYQPCLTRLILMLPLIKSYHYSKYFRKGRIFINHGDWADVGGLALCSNRADSILIPDTDFLGSLGYRQTMFDFMVNTPPWKMRKSVAFWRGNTTGVRQGDSWRDLPRIKLCDIANYSAHPEFFDVGVSSFAQVSKREAKEIKAAGLARDFLPINACVHYKYQIDIDGNSNAWSGLFQKLLSGSTVLKVASPSQFRQWYYDKLVPWANFVPVKSDLSDLVEKVQWLIEHDDEAQKIGAAGKELALSLSYESELKNTIIKVSEAVK